MIHDIGEGPYSISYDSFVDFMELLREEGYTTVSLEEIYSFVYEGADLVEKPASSFSYPLGYYDSGSENILRARGIKSTMTSDSGINTIVKGDPDSLYLLKRIELRQDMTRDELLETLSSK